MGVYRFFEIIPGALTWLTFILMFLLSWLTPAFVAVFIILFDIYWLLKSVYLSLHLRNTFSRVKANLEVHWLERLKTEKAGEWEGIWHLVILPMYKEPYEVVKESVESLARANYPREKLILVLSAEERGGEEARETAERIRREFGDKFFRFETTVHPANLPGEIPGKGSNETWAAKEAKRLVIDPLLKRHEKSELHPNDPNNSEHSDAFVASDRLYDKILVSVFDVDTQVFPEYFGRLTYVFLNSPNRLRAIYQPVPLFVNNIYQAPALARIVSFSTTFWQMMQQSRPERLTSFSSQAIPFQAVLDIGFWQKDIVSEDSRVFWQGYLRYHGGFRVEPLFYPVSMDANAAPRFSRTMRNLYRQQRRWAWGAENVAYIMCGKLQQRDTNDANTMRMTRIVEKDLSYRVNGILFRVHNKLGRFCRERQYGDAFVQELEKEGLRFNRESGGDIAGRKSNFLDFVIENRMIVELKAKSFISKEDYYQVQRYLQNSSLKLGLIVNFRDRHLKPKRILNPNVHSEGQFVDSHTFADSHRKEGFLYDKKIPRRKKWYWGFNAIEGYHSWATNSLLIFALGWLPLFLGGETFGATLLSYNLPNITRFIISLSMIGIASSAIVGVLLLPPKPGGLRLGHYALYVLQWLLLPLTLVLFGALPAIDAQTRLMLGGKLRLGFWVTPKSRVLAR